MFNLGTADKAKKANIFPSEMPPADSFVAIGLFVATGFWLDADIFRDVAGAVVSGVARLPAIGPPAGSRSLGTLPG
jgi:hypothetical protein